MAPNGGWGPESHKDHTNTAPLPPNKRSRRSWGRDRFHMLGSSRGLGSSDITTRMIGPGLIEVTDSCKPEAGVRFTRAQPLGFPCPTGGIAKAYDPFSLL